MRFFHGNLLNESLFVWVWAGSSSVVRRRLHELSLLLDGRAEIREGTAEVEMSLSLSLNVLHPMFLSGEVIFWSKVDAYCCVEGMELVFLYRIV